MMPFNHKEAYVWLWLPGATEPVVAAKLEKNGEYHDFFYGQSYLKNPRAIALSNEELPLVKSKRFTSTAQLHRVLCDSLPDSWGRRVLFNRYQTSDLAPLDLLLLSSSDRIGALHFQAGATEYQPRFENNATLEQLMNAAAFIETGELLPEELGAALIHGTSIGGARPKALISEDNQNYIAKFSASTDLFPIVQAEFAAMWLGKKIGLQVAPVKLVNVCGKYVLLVERFDREKQQRKFIISGLTMLGLDETTGRYASYLDLADQIRKYCQSPIADLHELFKRMVFNILIGNTDDHAKNHAFFWDGKQYKLTPAFDICPYLRAGQQATQAMIIGKQGAYSQLSNALSAAKWFNLSHQEAKTEIELLVEKVKTLWPQACEKAHLTSLQRKQLENTAVLNPYCFYEEP